MPQSKTARALELIHTTGMSPYAAAHQVGIRPVTVYAAMQRIDAKTAKEAGMCPTCGHKMPRSHK